MLYYGAPPRPEFPPIIQFLLLQRFPTETEPLASPQIARECMPSVISPHQTRIAAPAVGHLS